MATLKEKLGTVKSQIQAGKTLLANKINKVFGTKLTSSSTFQQMTDSIVEVADFREVALNIVNDLKNIVDSEVSFQVINTRGSAIEVRYVNDTERVSIPAKENRYISWRPSTSGGAGAITITGGGGFMVVYTFIKNSTNINISNISDINLSRVISSFSIVFVY